MDDFSRDHNGGGWGIRTPEGFHPTRFPSVRHRPLGESSKDSKATLFEFRDIPLLQVNPYRSDFPGLSTGTIS